MTKYHVGFTVLIQTANDAICTTCAYLSITNQKKKVPLSNYNLDGPHVAIIETCSISILSERKAHRLILFKIYIYKEGKRY